MIEINKNYNEDCLITMDRMPDNFVDLVVTSPPYDNLRDYNGYTFDFENVAKELYRVARVGGVVVWVVGDATIKGSETGTSFRQALYFKDIGFNLHDTMIYHKLCYVPRTHNRYEQAFEYMFCFSKGVPKTFNPIMKLNKGFSSNRKLSGNFRHGGNKLEPLHKKGQSIKQSGIQTNVWSFKVGYNHSYSGSLVQSHPATFPEQLANDHIISWSNPGDLVYDPFMGSGTTAKMAIMNQRNWIGSEISKEYCEIIEKRIKKRGIFY
jgi:site-specific DNA-methyltransferase (adenine-specific)